MSPRRIGVVLEAGDKRIFASAIDWPGWSRSARDEARALATLLAYAPRYARAVARVGGFDPPAETNPFDVVERLDGGSGTDFGVPSSESTADARPIDVVELDRQIAILEASRDAFEQAASDAVGVTLSTGPRGGGRSLEKIVRHVVEADQAYLQQLGSKPPMRDSQSPENYGASIRELQLQALRARVHGDRPPNPNAVKRLWTPRYFLRRAAWHLLDHAWEIEDRSAG